MIKHAHYLPKVTLFLTFTLYVVGLIAAWNHPIDGYESSIYFSTPLIFWMAAILCLIMGIFLILYADIKRKKTKDFFYMGSDGVFNFCSSFRLTGLFNIRGIWR